MSVTPGPPPQLPALGDAYGWGAAHEVRYLPTGLMNRNWRVDTEAGVFALKQLADTTAAIARRNLRVLAALIADGMPGCPPRPTVAGDPVAEIDGAAFCVLGWIDGHHPPGLQLSLTQAAEFGAVVGRIHRSLHIVGPSAGLPALPDRLTAKAMNPDETLREADRYLAAATAGGSPFDAAVVELLAHRKVLIDKYASDRPPTDVPVGRFGWTHGDLQYRNILWGRPPSPPAPEHIVGVLDWDRIKVRPYAEEVARTATIGFSHDGGRLDLPRIAAFVGGYRSITPLTNDEITDGVLRLWYKRLSDFWHLVFHYDHHDYSCDDLFITGEQTLEWWTANRDDVLAAFTGGTT
ncbi:MAG: phosphotransferase [Pseudonocardia sp.]|nr:phosphotransferase [Pseudonocardia sp.]